MESERQIVDKQKSYSSLQELFDDSYTRIVKQGQVCMYGSRCAYRSSDNQLGCAIGVLLSDETINESFRFGNYKDSNIAAALPFLEALLKNELMCAGNIEFLSRIQTCHDCSAGNNFINNFKSQMADVAKTYRLTVPDV